VPIETTDPNAPNVLGGIVDISGGKEVGYYLDATGTPWVSGNPVGWPGGGALFAERDSLFLASPPPTKAVEINGSHSGYLLRTEDGKLHFYGHGYEGMRGTGDTSEPKSNERAHTVPVFPAGVVIKQTGMGEYAWVALDTEGYVWVDGSSLEYQLGLGVLPGTIAATPVRLPRSAFGGAKVAEVKMNGLMRGIGQTGGDVWAARAGGRIYTCGMNHNAGVPNGNRWEGFGISGTGSFENFLVPQQVPLEKVTGIGVGFNTVFAVQKPGTPGTPPLTCTPNANGSSTTTWRGAITPFRDASGYEVRLLGGSGNTASSKEKGANPIVEVAPREWSWTSPVMASGEYTVKVIAEDEGAEPVLTPVGGELHTAINGNLPVAWALPSLPQPGWIVEYQHVDPLPGGGTENWRWGCEVSGTATSASINVTEAKFPLLGEEVRVRVTGAPLNAFGTRKMIVVV
jgi:hypothetical protein